jgi:hypothetical protein
VTTNSWGTNSTSKFITTYYRYSFEVPNASAWTNVIVRLQRDDGAIVYLNEMEVFRSNMPTGTVTATTLATNAVSGTAESAWYATGVDARLLRNGLNVLAVEVHQSSGGSSDLFFNLELKANPVTTPPAMAMAMDWRQLRLEWPAWAAGLSLFAATNLQPPVVWLPVTNATFTTNGNVTITVPLEHGERFFQLKN